MKLLQALRSSSKEITSKIEKSNLFNHKGLKGNKREKIIQEFIRPFLPTCYGIGSGEIFSKDGTNSNEIDIVIFDSVFSNILFRDEDHMLFPCESIYGTIEVKSLLNSGELSKAIENIISVKKLLRENSTIFDILPFHELKIGAGLKGDSTKMNSYLGIIFSYDGLSAENAQKGINQLLKEKTDQKHFFPDFIFCYQKGYVLYKVKPDNTIAAFGKDFYQYEILVSDEDTLPIFFFILNTCLNTIHLKAPNFDYYFLDLFNQLKNANTNEKIN